MRKHRIGSNREQTRTRPAFCAGLTDPDEQVAVILPDFSDDNSASGSQASEEVK